MSKSLAAVACFCGFPLRSDRDVPSPKRGYELPSLSGIRDVSEYVSGMLSLTLPQSRIFQGEKERGERGRAVNFAGAEESLLQEKKSGSQQNQPLCFDTVNCKQIHTEKRCFMATAHNSSERALPTRPNFDISANRSKLRKRPPSGLSVVW